jgi:carnitine O-acetyltransferase
MRDDYLSTSTVNSTHIVILGFGATSGRCIGMAHKLLPDHCI